MLIKHIDDVIPNLVDGFIVMDKGDYKVIDYVHIGAGFDSHPVLVECRGLIFDKSGNLIRRPLHKFWNAGERGVDLQSIDWTRPHVITDKLDGSMIAPFILNGEVRFGTRAGITEHSLRCEAKHLTPLIKHYCHDLIIGGFTPIFEWTSHENQIVLDYKEDTLTLLAIRSINNGIYLKRKHLNDWAEAMNVPLVEEVHPEILELVYDAEGIEGVVIHFTDDDSFIKVKSDEYVRAHRAVSYFERENMILPIVLNNEIDDLIPVLSPENVERLQTYYSAVWEETATIAFRLGVIIDGVVESGMDRKTFALEIVSQADERIRSCYFTALDNYGPDKRSTLDIVKEKVLKNPSILKTRWKETNLG